VREQAIATKVGGRGGLGNHRRSSAATQRPARRESGGEAMVARLRAILGYLPAFLKIVLAIAVGILVFAGYRAAASASFFQVRKVEVQGTSRVSADDVQTLVRKEVEKTGVWKADLKGMNARLEKLPWIKTAVVSRVLPDGIRVRIIERAPRAVVRTGSGRFRWVDEEAVLLGEMLPTDQIPPFFLRGLNEDDPEGARAENRARVAKFIELQGAWEGAGVAERVSEVNLIDMRDIRAQLAGDDSRIEIRLGPEDQGQRLKDALKVLDGQKQSARGALISYIDVSQGNKRAILGMTSGAHASEATQGTNATTDSSSETVPDTVAPAAQENLVAAATRTAEVKPKRDRADRSAATEKKPDKPKKPERHR
jgi:cell division septal protein FtsQ